MTKKAPVTRQLAKLGAEELADALVELAETNEDVARYVERVTSDEKQNIARFKAALTKLKRRRRFISYAESGTYAHQLRALLEDLEASVSDPAAGVSLVSDFIRCDVRVLDACDDSNGSIGDVFRHDASSLFAKYAAQTPDKPWIADQLRGLVRDDPFGVRDRLLNVASTFLTAEVLRKLAEQFWNDADAARASEPPASGNDRFSFFRPGNKEFRLVGDIARQLNDAALLERSYRASYSELGVAAKTDIAAGWLAAGQPSTALEWLDEVDPREPFMSSERDDLRRTINEQLGNHEEVQRLAWKRFREYRYTKSLDDLLNVIGRQRRSEVIASETATILESPAFVPHDAIFLIDCDRIEEAATYVVNRQAVIDGNDYSSLASLAKALLRTGQALSATVLYRALMDAILERGYSKAYGHAARYLKQLDRLAPTITNWNGVTPHTAYIAAVRLRHGKKASFWTRYERL